MNHAGDQIDWTRYLLYAVSSDVGMRRSNNQDSCAASLAPSMEQWLREGHLFMVADGMGAHAAGELASKLAADNVVHLYRKYLGMSPPDALERAVREANQEINRRGQENLDFHNMGTTCSVLLLLSQGALVAHVGDSRVYRLRKRRLHQLTFDHSLVWELREAGQIATDDSASSIPKNVITRSLGPHPSVRIDLEGPFPLEAGDTFLVCSDGLTGCVSDAEIAAILSYFEPSTAAQLLTDLANLRGGPDNITAVVVRVVSDAISSRTTNMSPLRVGAPVGTPSDTQVPPVAWIATSALGVAALVMFLAQRTLIALALAAAGAITLALTYVFRSGSFRSDGITLSDGRKLGRGPYRHADVPSESQFATELQQFVHHATSLAAQQQWPVDDVELQAGTASANRALDELRTKAAIDGFARVIGLLQSGYRAHVNSQVADR